MQLFDNNFIFSNRPRYRLARHGLFWLVVWLSFTLLYGVFPIGNLLQQGHDKVTAFLKGFIFSGVDALIFMPAHMTLAYGIIYVLFPRYLQQGQYLKIFLGILLFSFASASVSSLLSAFVVTPVHQWLGGDGSTRPSRFTYLLMAGFRGATTVAGFAAAIKLMKVWFLKQQAYRQIEKEKFQAELQLLKSQIHPHFLFNTLNNLYSLTLHRSDHSPSVVLKLAELLRYMLYEANAAEVPLEKEIAFLRNYIGLEQLRYGSRLDMSVTIKGDTQQKLIAPLLLIPLLENAFKHGTSEQLEQAWMHLDLVVQEQVMKFKLINSREADERKLKQEGGIGLQNVRKRLELLYPGRYELKVVPEEETFMVYLTLELAEESTRPDHRSFITTPLIETV
ncbi:sensor histidine kinase [Tellurirhabdus bombi]|uniref:sensor histidine kinase n=1 Tax=Tellurirhabdus bombi TaxID=2907205 RepID=UPI001F2496E0|nr:sensor histidine kinase [Tellurirhabdus bombi]